MIKNEKIIIYANKHRNNLTDNEYEYLLSRNYQISNSYRNPKLHKSKELNKTFKNQNYEYLDITKNLQIKDRLIIPWLAYYTSKIFEMLHIILEPFLSFIPHILSESFVFLEQLDTRDTNDTQLYSCYIKSLSISIHHDVSYKAIDYWIEKLINEIA